MFIAAQTLTPISLFIRVIAFFFPYRKVFYVPVSELNSTDFECDYALKCCILGHNHLDK